MLTIPRIDFRSGPGEICSAARTTGFFYLENHPIEAELVAEAFRQASVFFSLPLEAKASVQWTQASRNCGYVGESQERLAEGADSKEAFNVGREGNGCNLWPTEHPEFRKTSLALQKRAYELSQQLLRHLACGFELPESYFVSRHRTAEDDVLRLLAYAPTGLPKGTVRAGAHTDYGSLTLLFQDEQRGLQIESSPDVWTDVPPVAGAVLVNIGDLLQRWTNDVLLSAKHRVVDFALPATRYSIAYFCHPDPDATIAPLPGAPAKYPSVTAGQYLANRIAASYAK